MDEAPHSPAPALTPAPGRPVGRRTVPVALPRTPGVRVGGGVLTVRVPSPGRETEFPRRTGGPPAPARRG